MIPTGTCIAVLDFETNGEDSKGDSIEAIEFGVSFLSSDGSISPPKSCLIKPQSKISPESMAVHHITQAEAETGVTDDKVWLDMLFDSPNGETIIAFMAHNHDTEAAILAKTSDPRLADIPWICTYRNSVYAYPDAKQHKNQYLRYWLDFNEFNQKLASPAHRAGPDAYTTAFIGRELLNIAPFDMLVEITKKEFIVKPKFPISEAHRGKYFEDVPISFFGWMQGKDFRPDLFYSVKQEILRRRGEPNDYDYYERFAAARFDGQIPDEFRALYRKPAQQNTLADAFRSNDGLANEQNKQADGGEVAQAEQIIAAIPAEINPKQEDWIEAPLSPVDPRVLETRQPSLPIRGIHQDSGNRKSDTPHSSQDRAIPQYQRRMAFRQTQVDQHQPMVSGPKKSDAEDLPEP